MYAYSPATDELALDDKLMDALHSASINYIPEEELFWLREEIPQGNEFYNKIVRKRYFNLVEGTIFKATQEAMAFDCYNSGNYMSIRPGNAAVIPLGIKTVMSGDIYAQLEMRSGLAAKGLGILGGMIDADYRGEWKALVHNSGIERIDIDKGERCCQVVLKVKPVITLVGSGIKFGTSVREGGFGSTGK